MSRLLLLGALVSLSALADVGPRPAPCNVAGKGCTPCDVNAGEPPGDCQAGARDAGLVLADCSDRSGALLHTYYCPSGTAVSRSSCAAVPLEVLPVGALILLALRRRGGRGEPARGARCSPA